MIIHKLGRIAYEILGADLSTKLAHSPLGNFIFELLNPRVTEEFSVYPTIYDIKLKLSKDEAKNFGISYLGVINPNESRVLKQKIHSGDTFIDIGAYVDGWYTLLAAKLVGDQGKVYSIEPAYSKRLLENIALNNFTNVTVDALAMSDKNGQAKFYVKEGTSSLIKDQNDTEAVDVTTITLDDYTSLKNIQKIDFIKIDVEGVELSVLRGGTKVLSRPDAPDLIIEVIESQLALGGTTSKELLDYIASFGYKPYAFTKSGLTEFKGDYEGFNLYFTKRN